MAKLWELIEQAGAGAKEHVDAAKKRYLDQVRAVLRDLTRLKFSDKQERETQHTSVPIKVVPGLPEPLEELAGMDLPKGEKWGIETIGLWKHDIGVLQATCERLFPMLNKLYDIREWRDRVRRYGDALTETERVANELAAYAAQAELLTQIASIDKDVLGVYRAVTTLFRDRGDIELYWVVIGAVARLRGIEPGPLAVVVMTHELAHAYTHVGLDSNLSRWEDGFWECDLRIIEALAQYYTHKTVETLRDDKGYLEIWAAYENLTNLQMENGNTLYTNHLEWVEQGISPEAMRRALLDLRRGHLEKDFEKFAKALKHLATQYPARRARGAGS
jgi:hypothetical protein